MKKTTLLTTLLAVGNLFLLTTLFIACQKESSLPNQGATGILQNDDLHAGIQFIPSKENESKMLGAGDRGGIEGYPFDDGNCRLIFKVRDFDPNLPPEGGHGQPCEQSEISFKGYSKPNGQGTLLFESSMEITGDWQLLNIPSSAYIRFVILVNEASNVDPCLFEFIVADYGWNRNIGPQINIPYNQWRSVITGRFAPKDLSSNGTYYGFDEYLCDSWCTWTVPVSFENKDPFPDPWISAALLCYYGQNAPPFQGYSGDPRVIKKYFLSDNYNKTLFFYPISSVPSEPYRTEAADISTPDNLDIITYDVFGPNQQGAGPFVGWGVAPYAVSTVGRSCDVVPN